MIEIIALVILSVVAVIMLIFLGFWVLEHLMEYLYLLQTKYERIKRKLEFNRLCTCWNYPKDKQQCVVHNK